MKRVEVVTNKIVIIGAGFVGSSIAFALMMSGWASEIVIIDLNIDKAEGEVMDLNHGISFTSPVVIRAGSYSDCKDADIIIISAGVNQKPGETRMDLVCRNAMVFKDVVSKIVAVEKNAVILVVTNPVDILTYVTLKISKLPYNQVIGSGTVLDTARFRYLLSGHLKVDPRNVHAYIIGEHGDTEVPVWSRVSVAGNPIENFCESYNHDCTIEARDKIFLEVKNAAYEIINRKGATYYAVSLGVLRIVEAILRNELSVLTVSSYINGYNGVSDVCLSVPTIIGSGGVVRQVPIPLNDIEQKLFIHSAGQIKSVIRELLLD